MIIFVFRYFRTGDAHIALTTRYILLNFLELNAAINLNRIKLNCQSNNPLFMFYFLY